MVSSKQEQGFEATRANVQVWAQARHEATDELIEETAERERAVSVWMDGEGDESGRCEDSATAPNEANFVLQ